MRPFRMLCRMERVIGMGIEASPHGCRLIRVPLTPKHTYA
jgi:hypothetical protein